MRGPDVGVGPSSVLVVDWRASGYSAAAGGTACVEAAVCVRVVGDDGQVRYVPLPRDPDAGLSVQDKFVRAVGFWTEATDRKNGLPHQAPAQMDDPPAGTHDDLLEVLSYAIGQLERARVSDVAGPCLQFIEAVLAGLFPQGIKPPTGARWADDTAASADLSARRWLNQPDAWEKVRSWEAVFETVARENTATVVIVGRPQISHALVLINTTGTTQGVKVLDYKRHALQRDGRAGTAVLKDFTPAMTDRFNSPLGPVPDARALHIDLVTARPLINARPLTNAKAAGGTTTPRLSSKDVVDVLIDKANPAIGAPPKPADQDPLPGNRAGDAGGAEGTAWGERERVALLSAGPATDPLPEERALAVARAAAEEGLSVRATAELCGWSVGWVSKQLQELRQEAEYEGTDPANRIPVSTPAEQVVDAALKLLGGLRWRGGVDPDESRGWVRSNDVSVELSDGELAYYPDHMARWLNGVRGEPDENSTMNCWDAILFSAYRARVIDKKWIKRLYAKAAKAAFLAARDNPLKPNPQTGDLEYPQELDYGEYDDLPRVCWFKSVLSGLHAGPLLRYKIDPTTGTGKDDIPAGYLTFFDGLGHVALSLGVRDTQGRLKVINHNDFPRTLPNSPGVGYMQLTSVEELAASDDLKNSVIEFGAPPWVTPPVVQGAGPSATAADRSYAPGPSYAPGQTSDGSFGGGYGAGGSGGYPSGVAVSDWSVSFGAGNVEGSGNGGPVVDITPNGAHFGLVQAARDYLRSDDDFYRFIRAATKAGWDEGVAGQVWSLVRDREGFGSGGLVSGFGGYGGSGYGGGYVSLGTEWRSGGGSGDHQDTTGGAGGQNRYSVNHMVFDPETVKRYNRLTQVFREEVSHRGRKIVIGSDGVRWGYSPYSDGEFCVNVAVVWLE